MSGATKDITDVTKLLLSLSKYRADVLTQMSNAINKGKDMEGAPQAGILGQKPNNIRSVAELMLFDSDINVYEDNNVAVPEAAEFNIRGRKVIA